MSDRPDASPHGRATDPTPVLVEQARWDGRSTQVAWLPASFDPPRGLTTQAYGVCFAGRDQILLVSDAGVEWNLPGGHPDQGESLEQALRRELWEEACAVVLASELLGCQRVEDPGNPEGLPVYYQARFWARVRLEPFEPRFERRHRRLVSPSEFARELSWGRTAVAAEILRLALAAEFLHRHDPSAPSRQG